MGWLDVIWTGLMAANTAANISSAVTMNEMQKGIQRQQLEVHQRAEILDLIDKISRRVKRVSIRMQSNPQAVYVVCTIYNNGLRTMGITPSQLPPEDRRFLRDLNENLEDLIEDARLKLTDEQLIQAGDCLMAINELPALESAISSNESVKNNAVLAQQWTDFLAASENEWRVLNAYQQKPKTRLTIGIIILSIAGLSTCVVLPALGADANIGSIFGFLLYLAAIGAGVYLVIKGKNPYAQRIKELQVQRTQAINFINKNRTSVVTNSNYQKQSMESLIELRDKYNRIVNSILGDIGNIQNFLFSDD